MTCTFIPLSEWDFAIRGNHIVYIANTACKRKQGLQGVKKLSPTALLLFPNMSPGTYLHTSNCHFPIDVIYLNNLGLVIDYLTAYPNLSKIGPAPIGTNKIIEARGGWCEHQCINIGDSLQLYSSANLGW